MDSENRKPLTEEKKTEREEVNTAAETETTPVPVYAERAESALPDVDPDELRALALAYAKYLASHDIAPGEPTFTDSLPEIETISAEAAVPETEPVPEEASEEKPETEADAEAESHKAAAGMQTEPAESAENTESAENAEKTAETDTTEDTVAVEPEEKEETENE